jgi:DEAD/DEAH box helicase domain-containing protein
LTFLLSARTAGGKTEAFLIPIAQSCIEDDTIGVKALVFYPTKALANDQTNRYIEMLFHLNKRIGSRRRKVTLGLLHGDISPKEPKEGSQDEWELPLACPKCKEGTLKASSGLLTCDKCGELLDFVRVTNRQLVYSNPPDILITNPDTLVWDFMLRPQNHAIFGRPVTICKKCGWSYAPKGAKRVCENDVCKSKNLEEIRPKPPRIIVFDEIHIFRGTFGINCSYFISRLEGLIRTYSAEHHGIPDPQIVKIGSSATVSNPDQFAKDFFNCSPDELILVPKDDAERDSFYVRDRKDEDVRRHHVYIMPYAYNTDSTIGRSIHYLEMRSRLGRAPTRVHDAREAWGEFLQSICFVNSIRASNNLIGLTSRTVSEDLPDLKVNGHTTDFDKKQRANMERKFNRQDLHVIFATQTLEVGIDFRRVDVVMINGFPFSFNDYLQRIGRGGRKRDSLVVTVCQNWKPIDHYYYSNAKEALKNPALHIEPIPITRNNLEAVKKHARGAVLDFIMSGSDATEYVDDVRKLKNIVSIQQQSIDYCIRSLEPHQAFIEELKNTVADFLKDIQNVTGNEINSKSLFTKFREYINERYQLTSLRSTDREVLVEVMWTK